MCIRRKKKAASCFIYVYIYTAAVYPSAYDLVVSIVYVRFRSVRGDGLFFLRGLTITEKRDSKTGPASRLASVYSQDLYIIYSTL